jgi:signal transduction histidine kinase/CheY-like chemotaxis protein
LTDLLHFIGDAVSVAFVLLGLATCVAWLRRRDRSLGFLALAIILLSLVVGLSKVPSLLGPWQPILSDLNLLLFLASGYALLRFRDFFVPLGTRWHAIAVGAIVVVAGAFIFEQLLLGSARVWRPLTNATAVALILVWSALVTEPIVRFWLASRALPSVQRARLRYLSLGFAGLVGVLLVAIGVALVRTSQEVQIATELAVLAVVPLLYFSFSPPSWLRTQWRRGEEEAIRNVMQDLLLLREDIDVLAKRALDLSMRLVGADAAFMLDPDGKASASLGLSGDELAELAQRFRGSPHALSRVALNGSIRTALVLETISTKGSGRLVLLAGLFTPVFGSDELTRVEQYASAVTAALDRAHLIKSLQHANSQLRDANRHKSEFLANMSHELRTPLNAILGFSELMIDDTHEHYDAATRREFLQQIHTSGQHLLQLINDILDLSKIEAGHMELRLESVDVRQLADEVATTVAPLADKKHIQLVVDAAGVGEIVADRGKLKQMLLNLVSNAIKFTPDGGTVTISSRRLENEVEISVTDTGIGVAEEDHERIFEEFQQLDSGAGRQQQGTGLGLALTKRFVELHGGSIRLKSELGAGSVFTLALPLGAAREASAPSLPELSAPAAIDERPLILVVEDNSPAADLLVRHLERGGFRVQLAVTGPQALDLARRLQPLAITLDILLPELDGWAVLTELKRDESTRDIPVVIVSVVDDQELGRALGALDYFVKPVDAKGLLRRLEQFQFTARDGLRQRRVLVVDDEPSNRTWLTELLTPAGFTVELASGGQQAIDMVRESPPDLILLDLMMPGVSGFDVVETLQADADMRRIPIMILTAKNLTAAEKRQLNGHVAAILSRSTTGAADLIGRLERLRRPVSVP